MHAAVGRYRGLITVKMDAFALGVVIGELLTGRSAQIVRDIADESATMAAKVGLGTDGGEPQGAGIEMTHSSEADAARVSGGNGQALTDTGVVASKMHPEHFIAELLQTVERGFS